MDNKTFYHYTHTSGTNTFTVPEGTVTIGENAFSEGEYLYSIILPDTVKYISAHAFSGCTRLRSINLPDGLVSIGECAFRNCSHLDTVLPALLKNIGDSAFSGCWNLRGLKLSDAEHIGERAFSQCSHLESMNISGKHLTIGKQAFSQCNALTSAHISAEESFSAQELFSGCNSLKEAVLPESTCNMAGCFTDCTLLREIRLPSALQVCDMGNFSGSSLRSLHLHRHVKEILLPDNMSVQCLEIISADNDNPFFRCEDGMLIEKSTGKVIICPPGAENLRLKRQMLPEFEKAVSKCTKLRKLTIDDGGTVLELELARGFRPELIPYIILGNYRNIRSGRIKFPLMIFDLAHHSSDDARKLLKRDISKAMKFIISSGSIDMLETLLKNDIIPNERLDEFIALAAQNNCNEISLALLDHKNSGSGYSDVMSRFAL